MTFPQSIFNVFIFFLHYFTVTHVYCQITLIDSETQQPIPYVHIAHHAITSTDNNLSDINGVFNWPEQSNVHDTLVFSCTGYETKKVCIKELMIAQTVNLHPVSKNLEEVNISALQNKYSEKKLGVTKKDNLTTFYNYTGKTGEEKAVWIPNPYSASGFLKKVHVYFTDLGFPDAAIRMHIYECNALDKKPGRELTQSNRILSGTSGKEWVTIDLSQDRIQVGENGCFVGIEWFDSPKAKNYSDTIILKGVNNLDVLHVQSGNGAVLGSINEPYRLSKNKIWYRNKFNEWICWSLTDESRFNINDTISNDYVVIINEDNLCYQVPSIYMDVSFNKKKLSPEFNAPKKRSLNKIERVKEDAFKYPQSTVQELFHSLINAIEQDDVVYVLKFLCVYKESESEAITEEAHQHLEREGVLITETEKRSIIQHLTEITRSIDTSELVKLGTHQFELSSNKWKYNLTVENGKWKINPYSYRIID